MKLIKNGNAFSLKVDASFYSNCNKVKYLENKFYSAVQYITRYTLQIILHIIITQISNHNIQVRKNYTHHMIL
jgi:hypothetical protein